MPRPTRLELTWIGKDERPKLEPRVLIADQARSYHAAQRRDGDIFDNRLIFGDNLLALKALEQEFAGKVKCIYIDPPYNTGAAFTHYDDGIEHSLWLSLIRERLEILWRLLSNDGTIWVSIDDAEMPYLRVVMDEICGRKQFIAANVWQKRYSRENREAIGDAHEYVLTYSRDPQAFKRSRNRIPPTDIQTKVYRNPNDDPRGAWRPIPMNAQGFRANQMYEVTSPSGRKHRPPEGRCWSMIEAEYLRLRNEGRIYFGKDGDSQPNVVRYLSEVEGFVPWTWWPHEEVGHTDEAKKEIHGLFGKVDAFDTPKPERLLHRILTIATNPGDLVLDSFAGSGTTGAVAHKMGRRWIMVELGEHCHTHIIPRLKKVIDGQDPGGVTPTTGWTGGGGFRYFRLAPSLLEKDEFGNAVINASYDAALLAEAVCKLEGFRYEPSASEYWQQGRSSERDFCYVTTQVLSAAQLDSLSRAVGPQRTLVVACSAFRGDAGRWPNLTVKKIPQAVLDRCEWGRDDYSLAIQALPEVPVEGPDPDQEGGETGTRRQASPAAVAVSPRSKKSNAQVSDAPAKRPRGRPRKPRGDPDQPSLFGD